MNNITKKIWISAVILWAISITIFIFTGKAWVEYVMWMFVCIQWACLLTPVFQTIFNKK